jgi:hypothetical protein
MSITHPLHVPNYPNSSTLISPVSQSFPRPSWLTLGAKNCGKMSKYEQNEADPNPEQYAA